MLEIVEQMEPHTYRKNTVLKTFAVQKILYPLSQRVPFRSNIKRVGNKYVQVFYGIVNKIK